MHLLPALFVAASFLSNAQEAPAQLPSVSLPPPLQRVLTDYETAWQKRDAESLANLFTEDGIVMANGAPPVRGREAIRRYYAEAGGPLSLRAISFAVDGSLGYILGGFSAQKGAPDGGKFTLTLRLNKDGQWLIASDMDNMNMRPRAVRQ